MPRPPFFPLKAAWIKASERGGREGGPKSGPLRPMKKDTNKVSFYFAGHRVAGGLSD